MLRISQLKLTLDQDEATLPQIAARILGLQRGQIVHWQIVKKSIDARKKANILRIYTLDLELKTPLFEEQVLKRSGSKTVQAAPDNSYIFAKCQPLAVRPVVVGSGPAGYFAALVLAQAGLQPLVLERGEAAGARKITVENFWQTGLLNPQSNVQFGEGGAGTFSDGKLNTGIKDPRIGWILQQFVDCGAPAEIKYEAKPHIGTDILVEVVQNLRDAICAAGGEVRFGHTLSGITTQAGALQSLKVTQADGTNYDLPCTHLLLAIGHSARDTVQMLHAAGLAMEQKPFAMGVRIEHSQAVLDVTQYGLAAGNPALGAADYKLAVHLPDQQRSAFTFCMCPGGEVVAAASQAGGIVTNGMSNFARESANANSALLLSVTPEDFPNDSPLAGFELQLALEQKAFALGGGNYCAPAQTVGDFLAKRKTTEFGKVKPSYRPAVVGASLDELFPAEFCDNLRAAIMAMDRRLPGFAAADAVLTAPESRSSSPVRLTRNEKMEASVQGIYPAGEGAGYAGGIMSAAADGIKCAEAIIANAQ